MTYNSSATNRDETRRNKYVVVSK